MNWKRNEPIYMQIVTEMKNNISGQFWAPGTQLPNEFELAKQYGVSRPTLRNAMALLESEGYIVRRKSSGTIVAPDALSQKYKKLDIGFVSQLDLDSAESYIKWVHGLGPVLRHAASKGYFVRFIPWQYNSAKNYYDLEEIVYKKAIDAFIVVSPLYATDFLDELAENRIPHVALESHYDRSGVNTVMFDDTQTIQGCFNTLYEAGHRKIGLIAGLLKAPHLRSRNRRMLDSFLGLQQKFGLGLPGHWLQTTGENDLYNHPVDSQEMIKAILSDPFSRPTAIICTVEKTAAELIEYATAHGIKIPQELSIITTNLYPENTKISAYCGNPEELSRRAYAELGNWLKTPSYRPKLHLIERTLNHQSTISKPK